MRRIERFFLWSVIAILLITTMAKMVTVWGVISTPTEPGAVKTMLEDREPFFNLVPFRCVYFLGNAAEFFFVKKCCVLLMDEIRPLIMGLGSKRFL